MNFKRVGGSCSRSCKCSIQTRKRPSAAVHRRASASDESEATSPIKILDSNALPRNFCIIEDRNTVQDFAKLQLEEIKSSIQVRRNRIFLLMEEVRRLRIQERIKGGDVEPPAPVSEQISQEVKDDKFSSALPFLPELNEYTIDSYFKLYYAIVAGIIVFGGVIAPILEVRLGLGGTSYPDFIQSVHLPQQLAEVDPIVASFCGGAVGVLSALLIVEVNNIKGQQGSRCVYCTGSGYLECGSCQGGGCSECSFTGKVMCTSCLCTGKKLATEHDVRNDPFQ